MQFSVLYRFCWGSWRLHSLLIPSNLSRSLLNPLTPGFCLFQSYLCFSFSTVNLPFPSLLHPSYLSWICNLTFRLINFIIFDFDFNVKYSMLKITLGLSALSRVWFLFFWLMSDEFITKFASFNNFKQRLNFLSVFDFWFCWLMSDEFITKFASFSNFKQR